MNINDVPTGDLVVAVDVPEDGICCLQCRSTSQGTPLTERELEEKAQKWETIYCAQCTVLLAYNKHNALHNQYVRINEYNSIACYTVYSIKTHEDRQYGLIERNGYTFRVSRLINAKQWENDGIQ